MNEMQDNTTPFRPLDRDDDNVKPIKEGPVALGIEKQTSRMPSDIYLWSALGAMAVSAVLQMTKAKEASNFFGLWAPCLLTIGVYNKIVKVMGSDQTEKQEAA